MTKYCAAIGWTLSKTSCSQTALNGFVLDMSGSGQAKRICLQHLDMSRCRQIRIWSLRADLS